MKLFLAIFILCLIDYAACVLTLSMKETKFPFFILDLKAMLIFFTVILSSIALNYTYYWHHFFGIVIILIGIFTYTGNDIGFRYESVSAFSGNLPYFFLYLLVVQIFVSIQECSEKYLMDIQYISPYLLISLEGLIGNCSINFFLCSLFHTLLI